MRTHDTPLTCAYHTTKEFGIAFHEAFPVPMCASSPHSKSLTGLTPQHRSAVVPDMHEESLSGSRGHIQAQRGGKVINRVALSTSSRTHQTSTPRSLPLQKSHTRFSSS
jgi:hypothetical protein